ncbi:MAG: dockerin type I domain-containing protein [Pirellulaceae bacterium]
MRERRIHRRLKLEALEERRLMAVLPSGATPRDTAEFMLGRVAVTPVFLESMGPSTSQPSNDISTEDWSAAQITEVLSKIETGLSWWTDLLATKTDVHSLEFVYDTTYAVNPVPSRYEAINRTSNEYVFWVNDFLEGVGYAPANGIQDNIKDFNQRQREKLNADWSFTIFVVDSDNDALDGQGGTFKTGGTFSRAFAFAGGLFYVSPSTRPASTFAHEAGHIFWARDEYSGGGTYLQRRGYYNTQNLNAIDLNVPGFVQSPSIMTAGNMLEDAYERLVSPPSTLAMIGWQDSDGDGVFDVMDVPHSLSGSGRFDPVTQSYHFLGSAAVQTLRNQNSSGFQSDITLNRIDRVEIRWDDGPWVLGASPNGYQVAIDQRWVAPAGARQISIRAVDSRTGVTSDVFTGSLSGPPEATWSPGVQGFVWLDQDRDGVPEGEESPLSGWDVELLSSTGQPLGWTKTLEPDQMPTGAIDNNAFPGVTLSSVGIDSDGRLGVAVDSDATTGTKVFSNFSVKSNRFVTSWGGDGNRLKAQFGSRVEAVRVDVVGESDGSIARIEAYQNGGNLVARADSVSLKPGQKTTLEIVRPSKEIDYVLIRGQGDTTIKIDRVSYGPLVTATTDRSGFYHFEAIPSGSYQVRVTLPGGGFAWSSPSNGTQTVVYQSGQVVNQVDFGAEFRGSPWMNAVLPPDVDESGAVTPRDALLVINLLNGYGSINLAQTELTNLPMIDVNGDLMMTPLDALLVINYLNANGSGGQGEGELGAPSVDSIRQTPDNRMLSELPVAGNKLESEAIAVDQLMASPSHWLPQEQPSSHRSNRTISSQGQSLVDGSLAEYLASWLGRHRL